MLVRRKSLADRGKVTYHCRVGKEFPDKIKNYVIKRDKGMCIYCGETGTCIDHVVPLFRSGPSIQENAVLSCFSCNAKKAAKLPISMLTRAFFYLMTKGEDLNWHDTWKKRPTKKAGHNIGQL